nr:muscular LMNA-interacting protein isoform X2 [Paramormyrops kingsleyae]
MALDSREPLSGSGRDGSRKVSSDVLPFTFVPVLKKLQIKSRILPKGRSREPSAMSTECSGGQEADHGMYRAEIVFIGDSDEGDAGAVQTQRVPDELSGKGEIPSPFKMAADHLTKTSASDRRLAPHTENTMPHFCTSGLHTPPAPGSTNHRSVPGPCQDVPSAPVDGICSTPVRVTLAPMTEAPNSGGLLVSPASSRESVTWEDCAKHISQPGRNSPEGSLASLSRTESPCSSIWSGSFSPCVLRVERCSLAPGCSLAQASATQPAGTLSSKTAHKVPPSRLSLLTAILRKGRLPLLAPTPTRPYSPCWPVTPESQSSCAACSAASSLSSLWQGPSRSQSPSPQDKRRLTVSTEAMPSLPALKTMSSPPRLYPFQVVTVQNNMWPTASPPQPSSAQVPATPAISQTPPRLEGNPQTLTHTASPPHRAVSPLFSKPELVTLKPSGAPYRPVDPPLLSVTQVQESCLPHPLQNGIAASSMQHLAPPTWWSSWSLPLTPPKNPPESLRSSSALSAPGWITPPPSPPPSLVSSPSPTPRDGTPDSSTVGGGGRKKKYKIKTGYKALAAIPTNNILLEQQAIDDHVENQERPGDNGEESHREICSPAQLRQESEELYAAIDEVLENTMPMQRRCPSHVQRRSHSVPVALTKPLSPEPSKAFTLLPRPAGRETKYALSYKQQASPLERNLTKPGVIRPVGAVTKTSEADVSEEFQPNPFRKYLKETLMVKQVEPVPSCPGLAGTRGTEGGMSPPKGTQVPEKSGEAPAGMRTPILRITNVDGSEIQMTLADSSEYPGAQFSTPHAKQNETHI